MVFFVAEIGVNWDGDFEIARKMMQKSKECGCNAVKFQSYNEELVKKHPEKNRLMNSTINEKNIQKIDKIAQEVGIEWFSTPMYPEAVKIIEPYVSRFKVRELDGKKILSDGNNQLLENLMDTKKEIIISSEENPKNSKYYKNSNFKWLYCVPKYPCELTDLDFSEMKDFNGFSNHAPGIIAPLTAVILGADIIEVHVTEDKSKNYVDNNVSLDFTELNTLIKYSNESIQIKKNKSS